MIDDNSEEEGRRYCQLRSGDASADPLPRFYYEPLEPRCIRILELQPGRRSDPFLGKFIIANVDSDFAYNALSYMWGDATQTDRVVVDGAAIPVAWNLTRALEYLRDFAGSEPLRIWIDAICIDQNNFEERAEQVAMMRTIYHNASCVRIWINEPSFDDQNAAVAALNAFKINPQTVNRGLGDDALFWASLVSMLQNSYWNRIWM
ncbi:uncharacterized protein J4E84_001841 [Alternaria hordeiaustralica]|uniref:uncharacterized protein n=1 Tax=Alternaria hordeiaustralica TaxID=1187925 RepID=UPI0020C37097|nr:uncharacterized protein J4E84_001841 [Alternaria hordeiaustralica]KAI4695216.1 hypothetical protein J4E84_001841 [Alternaria hordeiaustralica]